MVVNKDVLKAKSVHTFAWPFEVIKENDIGKVREEIEAHGWKLKDWNVLDPNNFMLRQYLHSAVRDIFMNATTKTCNVYEFDLKKLNAEEPLFYVINDYNLQIIGLELHYYNFGAGVLFIQTINTDYEEIDDIRKINDLGRRICLPFLPQEPAGWILCADKLGITNVAVENGGRYLTNFRENIKEFFDADGNVSNVLKDALVGPAEFLYLLLGCTNERIEMMSDDRMFAICVLRDKDISDAIAEKYESDDWQLEELLYQLVHMDSEDATCQNSKMRKELLDKALYDRWSGWGTLHGVTNYSAICITTNDATVDESVVRPFIVEYSYIISLVLAQKIGTDFYSELAGKIIGSVEKPEKITSVASKELIRLQEKYIAFKNQVMVLEATWQSQGMEFYQLLQEQFLIREEQEILNEKLESLYEITSVSSGRRIEFWGLIFALAAIMAEVLNILELPWMNGTFKVGSIIVLCGGLFVLMKLREWENRRRRGR